MKKKVIFLIISILLLFSILTFYIPLVSSVLEDNIEKIDEKVEKVGDVIDDPKEYLRIETEKLKQKYVGKLEQTKISKFLTSLNPFFKFVFDVEFSWSWFFLLTLVLWLVFATFIYRILQGISIILEHIIPIFRKINILWPIFTVLLLWSLGISKIYKPLSMFIVNKINSLSSLFTQFIAVIILIIALLFIIIYSKLMKNVFVALRKKMKLERAIKTSKKTKKEIKKVKKELEEIEEGKAHKKTSKAKQAEEFLEAFGEELGKNDKGPEFKAPEFEEP